MARKKSKGTRLAVFSGKEASLNRVIFLILTKQALIPYDVWLSVRATKGFRHTPYRSICRRMQVLQHQGWLIKKGVRQTKPSGVSEFYEVTLRVKAALRLSEKSMDEFLQSATDEQLSKFIQALE